MSRKRHTQGFFIAVVFIITEKKKGKQTNTPIYINGIKDKVWCICLIEYCRAIFLDR